MRQKKPRNLPDRRKGYFGLWSKSPKSFRGIKKVMYSDFIANASLQSVTDLSSCLPTESSPAVVCQLTRRQIEAIPRDRYSVFVIDHLFPVHRIDPSPSLEEQVKVLITLIDQVKESGESLLVSSRRRDRDKGSGGGGKPPVNPFLPPITADAMSDCIAGVIFSFFEGSDSCTICNRKLNLKEFCVMMHVFFREIGILENESRSAFSEFLNQSVLTDGERFTTKTFNNYAENNAFKRFCSELEHHKVRFDGHPVVMHKSDLSILRLPFQEIGYTFLHTHYFERLRKIKQNASRFDI